MKKILNKAHIINTLFLAFSFIACDKVDDWLDVKSKLRDVKPTTLDDFQAILDDHNWINHIFPGIGLTGADNYYLTDQNFNSVQQFLRNSYVWAEDIYAGDTGQDWIYGYMLIGSTNIVLDGLNSIERTNSNAVDYDRVKSSALFLRSFMYYALSQIYCKPYSLVNISEPGLILRKSSDVNINYNRSTVGETYDKIISDLLLVLDIGGLPSNPTHQMRPSEAAANALLAKVYLSMENYDQSLEYSKRSLEQFNSLLDYNSSLVNPNSTYRFPAYPNNPEILFFARQNLYPTVSAQSNTPGYVDTILYESYDDNDLRKSLYYVNTGDGIVRFRGSYSAAANNFAGIATNEILLIYAESSVRTGNISDAYLALNTLLEYRYMNGTYISIEISDPEELLTLILEERRKELPFTGQLRWEDLRRLNSDSRFSKTLVRSINGITYQLTPNDNKYVFPIPDNEIRLNGIQQNPR